METTECPNPAYKRLKIHGLDKKILENREVIREILLYKGFSNSGKEGKILAWANKTFFNPNKSLSNLTEVAKDILEFDTELNEAYRRDFHVDEEYFEELMISHPSFIARLVLNDKLLNFVDYGFPTRKSLEDAIASYCLGEKHLFFDSRSEYVWRQDSFKNTISLDIHGDLYASQADVSGSEKVENNLFGQELIFNCIKRNVENKAICAYQDWSEFLIATLKYAKAIGKAKMQEITRWKEVLEETGFVGTNTAEAMFGSGGMDGIEFLMDHELLDAANPEIKKIPLSIFYRSYGNEHIFYVPCLKEGKLVYLVNCNSGDIELPGSELIFREKRFGKRIEYCEEDLPHILRATYKFFARDRSLLPKIMDLFIISTSHS